MGEKENQNHQEESQNIHVITINDWNCKRFHGYNTPNGTSYNSILIIDKFTTLVDTVPAQFAEEFFDALRQLVSFNDVYYIVIQHTEQESSGCLPMLIAMCSDVRVVCTRKCMESLLLMYPELEGTKFELVQVRKKDPDRSPEEDMEPTEQDLVLGKHFLSFRPVPLLHFPEQMITRLLPNNWLLSSDLFGQTLALSHSKYNEAVGGLIIEKAEEFAANTFGASATYLSVALKEIMTYKPNHTVPCHGYQLPKDATERVFKMYQDLLKVIETKDVTPRIAIVYESMWGATERMADFVGNYFKNQGVDVVMANMRLFSLEKLAQEAVKCTAFCFGSPTLNNGAMPGIIEAVNYLRGVRLVHGKKAIVFGSFGWGTGEGSKFIQTQLESAGIKVYGRVIWKFNYDRNTEQQMEKLLLEVFGEKACKATIL